MTDQPAARRVHAMCPACSTVTTLLHCPVCDRDLTDCWAHGAIVDHRADGGTTVRVRVLQQPDPPGPPGDYECPAVGCTTRPDQWVQLGPGWLVAVCGPHGASMVAEPHRWHLAPTPGGRKLQVAYRAE